MLYFKKSQPAPECLDAEKLKAHGDYKCGCVLERLKIDFKNKCYLCESKEPLSINVEHFKPHRGDKKLKFDWNNLFWSCAHCNNTKLTEFTHLLDCTNPNENIEDKLIYFFKPLPFEKVSIDATDSDIKTLETQQLLLAIFNGTTPLKNIESDNLRKNLGSEIQKFQKNLCRYFDENNTKKEKNKLLRRIRNHLLITSAYTSFKRQTIRDNEKLMQEFGKYLS